MTICTAKQPYYVETKSIILSDVYVLLHVLLTVKLFLVLITVDSWSTIKYTFMPD